VFNKTTELDKFFDRCFQTLSHLDLKSQPARSRRPPRNFEIGKFSQCRRPSSNRLNTGKFRHYNCCNRLSVRFFPFSESTLKKPNQTAKSNPPGGTGKRLPRHGKRLPRHGKRLPRHGKRLPNHPVFIGKRLCPNLLNLYLIREQNNFLSGVDKSKKTSRVQGFPRQGLTQQPVCPGARGRTTKTQTHWHSATNALSGPLRAFCASLLC
jgi:hypothetical protein